MRTSTHAVSVQLIALFAATACALEPPAAAPAGAMPDPTREKKPNVLIQGLQKAVMPPLRKFAEAPPITRSWVSAVGSTTSDRDMSAHSPLPPS